MSRKAKRGEAYAFALFPCLAVLLCSIGALIFILVVSVVNSYASAKSEAEEEIEELIEASDSLHTVSEELAARREKIKTEVDRHRRELSNIEEHIARLQSQLNAILDKARAIDSQVDSNDLDRRKRALTIEQLREEIRQKKEELADKIEKKKNEKPAFAIIPYSGANGTSRRPVYIECRKEGIVIQPEGTLISFEDLRPPHGPGNPLDAALRVLRTAYQKRDATFGITTPPYPLLVVRPDGIQTFALARSAMSGWDDQFGYELIDSDMKMVYPEGMPGVGEELSKTVEVARRRQAALLASLPKGYANANQDDEDEAWISKSIPINEAPSTSWGDEGSSLARGTPGQGGKSKGQLDETSRWNMVQSIDPRQVANGSARGASSPSSSQSNGSGGPNGVSSSPEFLSMNQANGLGSKMSPYTSYGGADLSGSYVPNGNDSNAIGNASSVTGMAQGQSKVDWTDAQSTGSGNGNSSNPSLGNTSEFAHSNGGGNGERQSSDGSSGLEGSGPNSATGGSSNTSSFGSSSSSSGGSGNNSTASSRANAFSSGSAMGNTTGSPAPTTQTDPYTGQPITGSGQPNIPSVSMDLNDSSKGTGKPSRIPPDKTSKSKRKDQQKGDRGDGDLKPISLTAGRDWATSRTEGKASPVTRPIRIIALSDQWLLRSEKKQFQHDAVITLDSGPTVAAKQLEKAVRERVDSWGLSLAGGYWCPTITIEYANDAELSVQRLQRLLEGSGVEMKLVPLQMPVKR